LEHITNEGITYQPEEYFKQMFEDEGDLSEFVLPEDAYLDSDGDYVFNKFDWKGDL